MPPADPFDLQRFVTAQAENYADALAELRRGRKATHWMWYVFPQLAELGSSSKAIFYGIRSRDEAIAYAGHPILGPRLLDCTHALLAIEYRSAEEIMGSIDALKLRSCATLFSLAAPTPAPFSAILAKYYAGLPDPRTLALLARP